MAQLFRVAQTVIMGEMTRIANVVKSSIMAIRARMAENPDWLRVQG